MNQTNHTPDHLSTDTLHQDQDSAHRSNQTSKQLTAMMNKEIIKLELLTLPVTLIVMGWFYLKFAGGSELTDIHPLLSINPTTNAIAVIAVLTIIGKAYLSFKIRRKYSKLQQPS